MAIDVSDVTRADHGKVPPLAVSYDHATDTVTVDGKRFSGELMRTWDAPTDRIYRFSLNGYGDVVVEGVVPCEECVRKFRLHATGVKHGD